MYHPDEIVVTENGMDIKGEDAMPLPQALNDIVRINNFEQYISAATDAVIIDKVRIKLHMSCIGQALDCWFILVFWQHRSPVIPAASSPLPNLHSNHVVMRDLSQFFSHVCTSR